MIDAKTGNRFFVVQDFDEELLGFLPQFYELVEEQSDKKDGRIEVVINSYGGYADVLKAYLSAFESAKSRGVVVATHVSGIAASCGSLLAIAGTRGHRTISEFSQHYVHLGSSGFTSRSDMELERLVASSQSHFDFVRTLYTRYAKVPQLRKKLETDHLFVDAQTSVDWQLVDRIEE